MSNAKRLTPSYDNNMCDDANGDYISYSECVKLTEQNKMLREALEALIQGYDCEEVALNFGIDQETAYKAVSALIDTEDTKC
jgi:hypothetical protein